MEPLKQSSRLPGRKVASGRWCRHVWLSEQIDLKQEFISFETDSMKSSKARGGQNISIIAKRRRFDRSRPNPKGTRPEGAQLDTWIRTSTTSTRLTLARRQIYRVNKILRTTGLQSFEAGCLTESGVNTR